MSKIVRSALKTKIVKTYKKIKIIIKKSLSISTCEIHVLYVRKVKNQIS